MESETTAAAARVFLPLPLLVVGALADVLDLTVEEADLLLVLEAFLEVEARIKWKKWKKWKFKILYQRN